MHQVTVREYAWLTTSDVAPSLDQHTVPESAFKYLCNLASTFRRSGAQILVVEGRASLRLDNYVGVVETPCGTRLEILPKHVDAATDADDARLLLRKMLATALDLTPRTANVASIELFRHPLTEWVMAQFLSELDRLVKQGIRSDYVRIEDEARFLRGQLAISQQLRQPLSRRHLFHIRYDELTPNRPENRLLRSALLRVVASTKNQKSWRLAHELSVLLSSIPPSTNQDTDFASWHHTRLVAHYARVRPWCELVLGAQMPLALRGASPGMSLLFPMDRLFERHVGHHLHASLVPGAKLSLQHAKEHLCQHTPDGHTLATGIFELIPDFHLTSASGTRFILDTKWKRIHERSREAEQRPLGGPYGISPSDIYQMFAYGQKYLQGSGDIVLIYPRSDTFTRALPPFHFSEGLRLWAVPFDLDLDRLEASLPELPLLPPGPRADPVAKLLRSIPIESIA